MLIAGRSGRVNGPAAEMIEGEPMKIYLLMVLISAIAALSHFNSEQKSPQQEA